MDAQALFDPAPLYGDREFDIGITTVFGGFTSEFYDAYNKHYPLAKGASYRLEFYRLYLLMVHLLKFGRCTVIVLRTLWIRFYKIQQVSYYVRLR